MAKKKEEDFANYKDGDTIWILVSEEQSKALAADWIESNYVCPLRMERSKKSNGMFVVTTKNLLWACRIIRWIGYQQVTYKTV